MVRGISMQLATAAFRRFQVHGPLLKFSMVGIQALGADGFAQGVPQPAERCEGGGFNFRLPCPLARSLESPGDFSHVYFEVVGEEGTDVCVLIVAHQTPGVLRRRGVDVHVDG